MENIWAMLTRNSSQGKRDFLALRVLFIVQITNYMASCYLTINNNIVQKDKRLLVHVSKQISYLLLNAKIFNNNLFRNKVLHWLLSFTCDDRRCHCKDWINSNKCVYVYRLPYVTYALKIVENTLKNKHHFYSSYYVYSITHKKTIKQSTYF